MRRQGAAVEGGGERPAGLALVGKEQDERPGDGVQVGRQAGAAGQSSLRGSQVEHRGLVHHVEIDAHLPDLLEHLDHGAELDEDHGADSADQREARQRQDHQWSPPPFPD